MFTDDQELAQRHHEHHAEQATAQGQQHHLQQLRRHTPHEQRRQGEDHARGQRAGSGACRLGQIGLEDRAATTKTFQQAEHGDGHHCHRDRGADGKAGTQSEIGIGRTEQDAEDDAEDDGLDAEFGRRFGWRDVGFEVGGWLAVGLTHEAAPGTRKGGRPRTRPWFGEWPMVSARSPAGKATRLKRYRNRSGSSDCPGSTA